MKPIYLRNIPGHPETYDHVSMIRHLAEWIKPEVYLEIGVRNGTSLVPVSKYAKIVHAVDISFNSRNFAENVVYYEMTSDSFFDNLPKDQKYDLVFIDGDHSKEQVYKDFLNASNHVVEEGFVLLHDTSPYDEKMLDSMHCSDAWEAILRFKKEFIHEWEILTLPFNPGLTIMKKISIHKQLSWK